MPTELSTTIIWAILGIALLIAEVFTMSFFLAFFGIAGILVAALKLIGLNYLPAEIIIFTLVGIAGVLLFRKKFVQTFSSEPQTAADQNQIITLTHDLPARGTGQVEYQGSPWPTINESDMNFKTGDRVRILRTEGIKLIVGPIR